MVENAFGILVTRFRVLLSTVGLEPENTQRVVMSCIILHNLMRMRYPQLQNGLVDQYDPQMNLIPGAWRNRGLQEELHQIGHLGRPETAAKLQRTVLKTYYSSAAGAVPWQDRMII